MTPFEQQREAHNNGDESPKDVKSEQGQKKIAPKRYVSVVVRSNEYLGGVLRRYPGFVEYDRKQHDITGVQMEIDHPGGIAEYAYNIVLE